MIDLNPTPLDGLDDLEWMTRLYTFEMPEPTKAKGGPRRFTKIEIRKVYLLSCEGATQRQIAEEIGCPERTLRGIFKNRAQKTSTDRQLIREAYERGLNHRKTYGQSYLTKSLEVLCLLREEMMKRVGEDCLLEESELTEKYLELREEIRRCFESEKRQREIIVWAESRSLNPSTQ